MIYLVASRLKNYRCGLRSRLYGNRGTQEGRKDIAREGRGRLKEQTGKKFNCDE